MHRGITKAQVEMLRDRYPIGTIVVLDSMDDPTAPPEGTKGIVQFVDDIGTVHVAWESGGSLGVVYGVDRIHRAEI